MEKLPFSFQWVILFSMKDLYFVLQVLDLAIHNVPSHFAFRIMLLFSHEFCSLFITFNSLLDHYILLFHNLNNLIINSIFLLCKMWKNITDIWLLLLRKIMLNITWYCTIWYMLKFTGFISHPPLHLRITIKHYLNSTHSSELSKSKKIYSIVENLYF